LFWYNSHEVSLCGGRTYSLHVDATLVLARCVLSWAVWRVSLRTVIQNVQVIKSRRATSSYVIYSRQYPDNRNAAGPRNVGIQLPIDAAANPMRIYRPLKP